MGHLRLRRCRSLSCWRATHSSRGGCVETGATVHLLSGQRTTKRCFISCGQFHKLRQTGAAAKRTLGNALKLTERNGRCCSCTAKTMRIQYLPSRTSLICAGWTKITSWQSSENDVVFVIRYLDGDAMRHEHIVSSDWEGGRRQSKPMYDWLTSVFAAHNISIKKVCILLGTLISVLIHAKYCIWKKRTWSFPEFR